MAAYRIPAIVEIASILGARASWKLPFLEYPGRSLLRGRCKRVLLHFDSAFSPRARSPAAKVHGWLDASNGRTQQHLHRLE
jgi:hypothetical protein